MFVCGLIHGSQQINANLISSKFKQNNSNNNNNNDTQEIK